MKSLSLSTILLIAPLALVGQTASEGAGKPASATPATPATPATESAAADPVVITVGSEKITKSEFERFLSNLPERVRAEASGPNKRKLAEQVAEIKALAQQARQRGLDKTPDVRQQIAFQTETVLASNLFREISAGVKTDEAAVRAFYDQHKGDYEQVKARHILVRTQGSRVPLREGQKELTDDEALAKAQALKKRVAAGEDFAAVAKAESDDTGSGASGGDLGTFNRTEMVPEFSDAAFGAAVGQVTEPVKSQFGYHIIQVQEKKQKTFEEVRPQIEAQMKPELTRKAVDAVRQQVPVAIDDAYFGK